VSEGLEPADEVAGLAGWIEMALVPVGAELLVSGVGIVVIRCQVMTSIEHATATRASA